MSTFETPNGLRNLLIRLETAGPTSWNCDPEAELLMHYTIAKYRPLAHRHHCEPEDSAVAAFEAMRTRAVREADDPWAVVTRAVQVSLIAEERSNGLLCSPAQARRAHISCHHDARRFSDTEADLTEFHPAFRIEAEEPQDEITNQDGQEPPTSAFEAVEKAIALFIALGWPVDVITCALDYIASRLIESGNRAAAHAMLRRDRVAHAYLDLERSSWSTLLRLTLGNPNPDELYTKAGHGILLRLLIGHPLIELLAEDWLVREISESAPRLARLRASHV